MTLERLEQTGLLDNFSGIICGDEVINRKPDPEIYIRICKMMNVSPEETLVIEDTGFGVRAAYNAGCKVIMVPSVNQPAREEKDMAFAVVPNLHEADFVIHKNFKNISVNHSGSTN